MCFHVFQIVQMVPNRAKRPIWESVNEWNSTKLLKVLNLVFLIEDWVHFFHATQHCLKKHENLSSNWNQTIDLDC